MFRRLLMAFDGSSHAQQALTEAIDLAQTNNGTLTLITVAPEPSVWAMSGYDVPINVDGVSKALEREYQSMLDRAVAGVPADVPVTKILKQGAAGPVIADEAEHGASRPRRDGIARAGRAALVAARERQPPCPPSEPRSGPRRTRSRAAT